MNTSPVIYLTYDDYKEYQKAGIPGWILKYFGYIDYPGNFVSIWINLDLYEITDLMY